MLVHSLRARENFCPPADWFLKKNLRSTGSQTRGYHTARRMNSTSVLGLQQKRSLYLKRSQALEILRQKSIPVNEEDSSPSGLLSISVDRSALSPCIVAVSGSEFDLDRSKRIPFSYTQTTLKNQPLVASVATHLSIPPSSRGQLGDIIQALWEIFKEKEAFVLECGVTVSVEGNVTVCRARFGFDDAAYRSSGRQEDIHRLRNKAEEVPEEVEAEKDGIVYVKYVCKMWFLSRAPSRG